jgi:hypothetical protein
LASIGEKDVKSNAKVGILETHKPEIAGGCVQFQKVYRDWGEIENNLLRNLRERDEYFRNT